MKVRHLATVALVLPALFLVGCNTLTITAPPDQQGRANFGPDWIVLNTIPRANLPDFDIEIDNQAAGGGFKFTCKTPGKNYKVEVQLQRNPLGAGKNVHNMTVEIRCRP